MSGIAALVRRRRRGGLGTYVPVATALQWIDGPPAFGAVGSTANSRAIVVDQRGAQFVGGPTVSYASGTPSVATVNSSTGVVTSVANGTSVITAAATGLTSITQTATVSQVVSSITGVSSTLSTNDAANGTFTPTGKDANGNTVSGATFSYGSSNNSVITVNASTGAWAGQSAGTATITITANPGGYAFPISVTVAHLTYTLTVTPNPITGANGGTVQVTVMEDTGSGPVDVTADSGTVYSIADTTKATVDVPTLTSVSPTTITQGASGSYTFTGTNIKGNETIGGLPSGVTASGYSYTSTTVTCTLTATAGASTGAASVTLVASGRGTSGAKTLTVNASGGLTALPVSGAVLRLHAGAGVTLNGSTVSAWADQTATGAVFSQATGTAQPTFVANVYNGATKPTLRFAAAQYLATASTVSALNPSGGNFTAFVVAKTSSVEFSDRYAFASRDTTANTGYAIETCNINKQYGVLIYTGTGSLNANGGTSDATTLHTITLLADKAASNLLKSFKDNASINSNGPVTFAANTTTPAVVGGDSATLGSGLYKGDICEIIVFPNALNSTQLTSMESYFQTEWGTP